MKQAPFPMSHEELVALEAQLQAHAPEEGITITYSGGTEQGSIAGTHPIKWNADFTFSADVLTVTAKGFLAGQVIDHVKPKLSTALETIRRPA